MKPLSIRFLATAGLIALFSMGFTPKPATGGASKTIADASSTHSISANTMRWLLRQSWIHVYDLPAAVPKKAAKWDISYYWYTYPADTYIDYKTVSAEEWELWIALGGVEIDTNPIGGVLLEEGYLMYGKPHDFVSVFLYGHFLL